GVHLLQADPALLAVADDAADHLMRLAERHPMAYENVREVCRGGEVSAQRGCHAFAPEPGGRHHLLERRKEGEECIHGVEDRLLVLLHVLVVRKREALHHAEQRHQIAEYATGLAPRKLRHIRIFLLWHNAAARRDAVIELDEAEFP